MPVCEEVSVKRKATASQTHFTDRFKYLTVLVWSSPSALIYR